MVALACQKPKELGYAQDLWTTRLLAKHVRQHGGAAGHPSLQHLARGTAALLGVRPPRRRIASRGTGVCGVAVAPILQALNWP